MVLAFCEIFQKNFDTNIRGLCGSGHWALTPFTQLLALPESPVPTSSSSSTATTDLSCGDGRAVKEPRKLRKLLFIEETRKISIVTPSF